MDGLNYIDIIAEIVEYIEKHIKENLLLEEISAHVSLSKYHIHRIFKSLTNKSLMEYVRGRKLTHSIKELTETKLNIIDIACEYHFEHEQSYIRAFKNAYKITPGQFRKRKVPVVIESKLDISHIHHITGGMLFEPVFIFKPEFYLVGNKYEIDLQEDRDHLTASKIGHNFYFNQMQAIQNIKHQGQYIGYVEYIGEGGVKNYYMPSVEVTGLDFIPEDMSAQIITANKYAVFKYIGLHGHEQISVKTLREIINFIYEWTTKTNYKQASNFHLERIDQSICTDDYCEVEMLIPILE